jgi:hypothetical protein
MIGQINESAEAPLTRGAAVPRTERCFDFNEIENNVVLVEDWKAEQKRLLTPYRV